MDEEEPHKAARGISGHGLGLARARTGMQSERDPHGARGNCDLLLNRARNWRKERERHAAARAVTEIDLGLTRAQTEREQHGSRRICDLGLTRTRS